MKHLNTRLHRDLSLSVVNRYCVKNPIFLQKQDILKNTFMIITKVLDFFLLCLNGKWISIKIFICVKSDRIYNIHSFWDIRRYLITKIDYFERQGYNFSQICEMKIIFISDLRSRTSELYLKQPKEMIEWVLNKKLQKNPEPIKKI